MKVAAALEEDPTVYQYDEVYDQMEAKKQEDNAVKNADKKEKKPRYIHQMLKNAERQKRENERRIERQVQKEREEEGEQFADKEKYVTSAYRKKMEEMARLDEEEERIERIEKVLDVTGQKDMSGFYRHLYRQTMGEEKGQSKDTNLQVDTETDKVEIKKISSNKREYRRRKETSNSASEEHSSSSDSSDSESDESEEKSRNKEKAENIDEQEIDHQRIEKEERRRQQLKKDKERRDRRKRRIELGEDSSSNESDKANSYHSDTTGNEMKLPEKKSETLGNPSSLERNEGVKEVKKPKTDIWKKVTVGDVFEAALQRYLIRKASRTTWP